MRVNNGQDFDRDVFFVILDMNILKYKFWYKLKIFGNYNRNPMTLELILMCLNAIYQEIVYY